MGGKGKVKCLFLLLYAMFCEMLVGFGVPLKVALFLFLL